MSEKTPHSSEQENYNTKKDFFKNTIDNMSQDTQQKKIQLYQDALNELQADDLSQELQEKYHQIVKDNMKNFLQDLANANIQELTGTILDFFKYLFDQNRIDRQELIEIASIGIEMQKHKKQQIIDFCITQIKYNSDESFNIDKILDLINFLNDLAIQKYSCNSPDFFGQIFQVFVQSQNLKHLKNNIIQYIFGQTSEKLESDDIQNLLNFTLQITKYDQMSGQQIIQNFDQYFITINMQHKSFLFYIVMIYTQELKNNKNLLKTAKEHLLKHLKTIVREYSENQQLEFIESLFELLMFQSQRNITEAENYLQNMRQNTIKYFKDIQIALEKQQRLLNNLYLAQKFAQYQQKNYDVQDITDKIQYILENYIIGNCNYYIVEVIQKCLSFKYWIFKNKVLSNKQISIKKDCEEYVNFLQAMSMFKDKNILKTQQFSIRLKAFQALISIQSEILHRSQQNQKLLLTKQDKRFVREFIESFFNKFDYIDEHLSSTQKHNVEKMLDNSFEENTFDQDNKDFDEMCENDNQNNHEKETKLIQYHDQLEYFCKQLIGFLCAVEKYNKDEDEELEMFLGQIFIQFFQVSNNTNSIKKILYTYLKNLIKRDQQRLNKLFWKLYMYMVFKTELDNNTIQKISEFFKLCWTQFYKTLQKSYTKQEASDSNTYSQNQSDDMMEVYKKFLLDYIIHIGQVQTRDGKGIYFKIFKDKLFKKEDIEYDKLSMDNIFNHYIRECGNLNLSSKELKQFKKSFKFLRYRCETTKNRKI